MRQGLSSLLSSAAFCQKVARLSRHDDDAILPIGAVEADREDGFSRPEKQPNTEGHG